ncbi:MAG: hypothetical protein FWC70_08410 [Defluviitaleaceae bacterium]|nr:hypothetical protein [Defluviitaleaceae bacterium]
MKKRIIAPALILIISGLTAAFIFASRRETADVMFTFGGAEAVAVTPVELFDGLCNSQNIFDELYYPVGIALTGDYIVVADSMCDRVQFLAVDESRRESRRVGRHGRYGLSYYESGAFVDGRAENAMFMKPSGVFVTPDNYIIVSDTGNHAIRKIRGNFVITIAGNGTSGFADGAEGDAMFAGPRAAVMCAAGYIYVADTMNHVIRRISPFGGVELFAGSPGESGFSDGALRDAKFFEPSGLYITNDGRLYVADSANHSIRVIENGEVRTVAGKPGAPIRFSNYTEGGHLDGANDEALFNFPRDIALLPDGSILVADSLNHSVRLITPDGTRTLLGGGQAGQFYYSAENLRITRPEGIATNGETLFISDSVNNRVLAVPLTERVLAGRPSREKMLAETGLTVNSRFAFRGDIRIFFGNRRIDMGRVQPWIGGDSIFIPVRPFLEALGAQVYLDERTGRLYVMIADTVTILDLDRDYFILRGVMVTTLDEMTRLFPYTAEWFPALSLIALHIPPDLEADSDV